MRTGILGLACVLIGICSGVAQSQQRGELRRIPPAGVQISDADRSELQAGVDDLGQQIESLRQTLAKKPAMLELLPDVQIFHNAVRYALKYDEFFKTDEVGKARVLLKEGLQRAAELKDGKTSWTQSPGLIVRGYVSEIDGSVQPYGLVIPESVAQDPARKRRLDVWYHGRGETLSEINFLSDRQRSLGDFAPPDTIVLHPYGRYCNANRFAGEVDTFEALASARRHYAVDENRISVRGFSMGGAACWMFATHYSGLWAAAAPGAGFSETQNFLHIRDLSTTPWYEQKLWHLYDSTDYAINLFNCSTVAYSGAADPQKQAADAMTKALADVGMTLTHVIGPGNTKHFYHPQAKLEVARRVDAIADRGRNPSPWHVKFTTWTLKYNQMRWVQVDGLEHHWERAEVDAKITHPLEVEISTKNVTALTLNFDSGACPLDNNHEPRVTIDHHQLTVRPPQTDHSWEVHFRKNDSGWTAVDSAAEPGLHKQHDLQGPIDDAFMESFVMVKPTGKPLNDKLGQWVDKEMNHAVEHWRRQFRGEARVKDDTAIDDADIASSNLVLWGDPSSNAILKKIVDKLPVRWNGNGLKMAGRTFAGDSHLPILIYPNPLNPKKYVVLNSGFTFREAHYLSNAWQTPKLPDWVVVDASTPATGTTPGKIEDAGFFGEQWEPLPDPPEKTARP